MEEKGGDKHVSERGLLGPNEHVSLKQLQLSGAPVTSVCVYAQDTHTHCACVLVFMLSLTSWGGVLNDVVWV